MDREVCACAAFGHSTGPAAHPDGPGAGARRRAGIAIEPYSLFGVCLSQRSAVQAFTGRLCPQASMSSSPSGGRDRAGRNIRRAAS